MIAVFVGWAIGSGPCWSHWFAKFELSLAMPISLSQATQHHLSDAPEPQSSHIVISLKYLEVG